MSSSSSSAVPASNYGRQQDNQQNIKQFVAPTSGQVTWVYRRELDGSKVITTTGSIKNVLIQGDLQVLGSIYNPSDKNLKNNIQELNEGVKDKLFDLNPVEFIYNDDPNNKKHYGLIAQDVENIYPELVMTNGDNYKSINYVELVPILLSKMKDMDNTIKNMQNQINELKNK
jgi:hypothetical protein